ncbi:MAG: hypothetical protein K8S23_02775 [Candidatus Cloacimonetes bacterium]|nr:hypothetical protein [Candidatus Cloacimonadota bacterium]
MKTIKILMITLILVSFSSLFSVFNDYEPSPRARALGGAYYTISNDANAIFYNPAGLNLAGNCINASNTKPFGNDFQKLNNFALSVKLPEKFGTVGMGLKSMKVSYLDVNLHSEYTYSLGHAFTLMKDIHSELLVGYTANFYHVSTLTTEIDSNDRETQNTVGFDVGALATLHRRTKLAFTVTNINNPKFTGEEQNHDLPRKFAMGISYEPYYGVSTSLELKKTFEQQGTEVHAGIEFVLYEILTLRTGLRNLPSSYSIGFGLDFKNILIDYGFNTHEIGCTHHFGIGYKL